MTSGAAMRDGHGRSADSAASRTPGDDVPAEVAEAVRRAVLRHRDEPGPLMEILHDLQAGLGCIPRPAVRLIAAELNLSPADVFGVVTFYKDFRQEPAGRR